MVIKMNDLSESLNENKKIYFPVNELNHILSQSEILFEQNTLISDFIRIIKIHDRIIVQEKTDKNEIALHLFQNFQEAEKFVNERIDIYEKMWDGCGCKVRYYDD